MENQDFLEKTRLEQELQDEKEKEINLRNSIDNMSDDPEEAVREHHRKELKSRYEDEC